MAATRSGRRFIDGWRRAGATLAAIGLAVVAATGCSVEHRLDRTSLEAQIQDDLFPEYPGLVSAVNCPEIEDPLPGQGFACAAQVGSQIIDVPVELAGTEQEITATIGLDERFVEAREIAVLLAEAFTGEVGIETLVDCGQPIVVLEPGQQLRCDALDPSGVTREFDVLVDDAGRLQLSIR